MTDAPTEEEVLDLRQMKVDSIDSIKNINDRIRTVVEGGRSLKIANPDRRDFLCPGLQVNTNVRVDGNAGDFCFIGNRGIQFEVHGDAGIGCGQAQQAGSIVIHRSVGPAFGSFCQGGWLAAYGNADTRCAAGLKGGEVIVRGNVGPQAGFRMQGGLLVIGGSAGPGLGSGLQAGTIFIRGDVDSIDESLEEIRMKESDRFKLGLLMLKAGIKAAGKDFRGYRRVPT